MIEGWGPGMCFGRADQYLYPFYKKDIEEGKITREEALELIELFYIKLNETLQLQVSDRTSPMGLAMQFNITVGGVTEDGEDAVNELSYLFIEADETVKLKTPDVVVRVNKINPEAFLIRACEALKTL